MTREKQVGKSFLSGKPAIERLALERRDLSELVTSDRKRTRPDWARTKGLGFSVLHRVSSSLLGPVDPPSRALHVRIKFTARRHEFNTDSLPLGFHTVEHDPFIKSQLASRNQHKGQMWCKFGHVAPQFWGGGRNPRTPPCGWSTKGPSWGYQRLEFGAIGSFLSTFGEQGPRFLKNLSKLTFEYPHEEPCVVAGYQAAQTLGVRCQEPCIPGDSRPAPAFTGGSEETSRARGGGGFVGAVFLQR